MKKTGRTCNVETFTAKLGIAAGVPIVDGTLDYHCPSTHETNILIIHNDLQILSMINNRIPPFITREGGVTVNDKPRMNASSQV